MNYQDTLDYNRRTMSEAVATRMAVGRHRTFGRLYMSHVLTDATRSNYPRAQLDRYDHIDDLSNRRLHAADMAALRHGVSTYDQRKRIANCPALRRAYGGGFPNRYGVEKLTAAYMVKVLNKIAGTPTFCLPAGESGSKQSIFDAGVTLVEDMRQLYDGTYTYVSYATESPHFPGMLYNIHDMSRVDVVVKVERGRFVTASLPQKLVEMAGARSLMDILTETEGETVAAQLVQRISATRGTGANVSSMWVIPSVVTSHPRLFKAEFLRVNYGRGPGDYHSSARYLRGEAEAGEVTLGLEWEIGVPNTRRTIIVNRVLNAFSKAAGTMEYVHAERDGSLNGHGVEFVFAYRSLDRHKAIIDDAFASDGALPQRNQTLATRLTNSILAGIHVHVGTQGGDGRQASSRIFGRMHNVMTVGDNRGFINALAGRRHGHYNRYEEKFFYNHDYAGDIDSWLSQSRYRVVNMRGSTVEIRAFASSTEKSWLLMTLEFADALRNYCDDLHGLTETSHANAHNFVAWVRSCADCYPNLIARIDEEAVAAALALVPTPAPTPGADADPLAFLRDLEARPGRPLPTPRSTTVSGSSGITGRPPVTTEEILSALMGPEGREAARTVGTSVEYDIAARAVGPFIANAS